MSAGKFENIIDAMGSTPIVRLQKIGKEQPHKHYVKLEFLNPGGSVKDRIGMRMIEAAEKKGVIKPGGTIVEGTSGNTGVGLAIAANVKGYKTIFVMPDKMSTEKIRNLRAFGAQVIITPTAVEPDDPRSYYSVARRIAEETPNAFYVNQYTNEANPQAHYETTGPEIWEQTKGQVDIFVAGMGTGGTISGVGKFLKEKNPKIKIIGIDPIGSLYYEFFKAHLFFMVANPVGLQHLLEYKQKVADGHVFAFALDGGIILYPISCFYAPPFFIGLDNV